MSDFVTVALKDMSPAAAAAISVLMTVVGALVTAIIFLFRQNGKLNVERRAEGGAFIKVIEANNTALNKTSAATEDRNKVTSELADAIKVLAAAFELVTQRVDFHHEDNKEKLKDLIQSFSSMSEAMRTNTSMSVDVRNGHTQLSQTINEMKSKVDAAMARRGR